MATKSRQSPSTRCISFITGRTSTHAGLNRRGYATSPARYFQHHAKGLECLPDVGGVARAEHGGTTQLVRRPSPPPRGLQGCHGARREALD